MLPNQWRNWATLIAAAFMLAACGGESGSDTRNSPPHCSSTAIHTSTTTSVPSRISAGGTITFNQGLNDGAATSAVAAPVAAGPAEDPFAGPMAAFAGHGDNGYFNSSVKFVINSLGAQDLLDHLERFKQTTQLPEEHRAAERFMALIQRSYAAPMPPSAEMQAFMDSLQEMSVFNELDDQGEPRFKLKGTQQEPLDFLPMLAQAFKLDTLPGWSIDTTVIRIGDGMTRLHEAAENDATLYHIVQTDGLAQEGVRNASLQQIVDLLHRDHLDEMPWNASDPQLSAVKIKRSINTVNIEETKSISLILDMANGTLLKFNTTDRVSLPVFDGKSGRQMLLTLQPSTILMQEDDNYYAYIKNGSGRWNLHLDGNVTSNLAAGSGGTAKIITLAVIDRIAIR